MKILKKILFFSLIFVIIFIQIGNILQPKWCFGDAGDSAGYRDKMAYFYDQEKGSIDVIFLGASHTLNSFLPIELYQSYGITSYNLGSSSQFIETSFFLLEEALHYQKPKYVVLDASGVVGIENKNWIEEWHHSCNYKMISSIKNLSIRYDALLAIKPETETFLEWCIPAIKFHSRWNELEEKDWSTGASYDKYPKYLFGALGIDNSVRPWYEYRRYASDIDYSYSDEYMRLYYNESDKLEEERIVRTNLPSISASGVLYLNKINNLCKKNDITLICVKAPTAASWDRDRYLLTKKYLENNDIRYIDFNFDDTGIEFDWDNDTLDYGMHANFAGALKATDYIGQCLAEYKNLEDHRTEEGYDNWNMALQEYRKIADIIMFNGDEKAYKWLDELNANLDDKVVFMTVKDDMSACWNEEYSKRMTDLGLTGDLGDYHRCSYIAIIDEGNVEIEKYGDKMIVHKAVFRDSENTSHKAEIISRGMKQGNWCNVYIDGIDYAYHGRGLNIVIFDKEEGKVTESVCIDTLWEGEFYRVASDT